MRRGDVRAADKFGSRGVAELIAVRSREIGRAILAAGAAAVAASLPAAADDATPVEVAAMAPAAAPREGVEVFEPDFFEVYNPVTARDMVQRLPGFAVDGGGGGNGGFNNNNNNNRRGFGANATNVLINSARPSSKSSINDQLGRISAGSVERIELLRGAALAEVDVRGQTLIANVVLRPGASLGAVNTYIAELKYNQGPRLGYDLQGTRTFQSHGADVTLDIRLPTDTGRGEQIESLYDGLGGVVERRDEYDQHDRREIVFNGGVAFSPNARDAFNANVQLNPWLDVENALSNVFDADGDFFRQEATITREDDAFGGEIGGDWEHRLADGLSFKLLSLATYRTSERAQTEETFTPVLGFAGTTELASSTTSGERIGRGVITWRAADAHTLEVGLEGAFNFRDSELSVDLFLPGAPAPVPFFFDEVRVEELRGEAFVTDVWSVSPRLTLEAGFTFEASRISQIREGLEPFEREFTYPKPRLAATYARQSGDQLRFVFERDVAQLDFGEFASSVSLGDNRTEAGNRELEPAQTWKTSMQYERRFGARGAVTLEAFYNQVEGVQDRIPVVLDDGDPNTIDPVIDGAGNLGDGTKFGVRLDATLPLDLIRLSNAELRIRGTRQKSEVEDPVTFETRRFSGDNDWFGNIDFRQDVPALGLAWGAGFNKDGLRDVFRVHEQQTFGNIDGFLQLYVETTRFMGVTVRLQMNNANDSTFIRRRAFWGALADPNDIDGDGDYLLIPGVRTDGEPTFVEERVRGMGRFYGLRVSGTF
jgi:hypothetical protein